VLASDPYAGQWKMLRELDRAGVRVVLGVWGGPDQFTDDGTRRGTLLPRHDDDYVEYVVSVVDFLVAQRYLPIWAITIANEPDGGDGNQISPTSPTSFRFDSIHMAYSCTARIRPAQTRP
jgi:hypothetical protein